MKVSEVANNIIQTANSDELKGLQTLKTVCNSDSAFVAAVKKYQAYQKLLQKAFLLSRTWQKFGQARTKAYENGAWVREAAMAYAEKQKQRANKSAA